MEQTESSVITRLLRVTAFFEDALLVLILAAMVLTACGGAPKKDDGAAQVQDRAAKGGDAQAQTYVGEIYEQGMGVEPDFASAAQWYAKAAEQGDSRAMINLGALYETGRGVTKDLTRAMNLYREASGITDGVLEYATDEDLARRLHRGPRERA